MAWKAADDRHLRAHPGRDERTGDRGTGLRPRTGGDKKYSRENSIIDAVIDAEIEEKEEPFQ